MTLNSALLPHLLPHSFLPGSLDLPVKATACLLLLPGYSIVLVSQEVGITTVVSDAPFSGLG